MFNLFVEFLSFITSNLEEYILQNTPADEELLQQIFTIYTLIKRIEKRIDGFARTLQLWQQDFYHGAAWSAAHSHLSNINMVMAILGEDLHSLIATQNPELDDEKHKLLSYKLRGTPHLAKTDIFGIWRGIIEQNTRGRFCGWINHYSETQGKTLDAFGEIKFFPDVERRTLFLPDHSVLLPNVKRTSEINNLSKSQWASQINAMEYFSQLPEWHGDILNFLPEFPPSFPIQTREHTSLNGTSYALMIEVPEQEQMITEIIAAIEKQVADFHQSVNQLKHTLQIATQQQTDIIFWS